MNSLPVERRRDPRTVCSVLSEILVFSPDGHLKYFAPAIVADISASGLSLNMDLAPTGANKLRVRNSYFEADVYVRNRIDTGAGFRIGCEFLRPLEWLPVHILPTL
jgi:hypothetical protein